MIKRGLQIRVTSLVVAFLQHRDQANDLFGCPFEPSIAGEWRDLKAFQQPLESLASC